MKIGGVLSLIPAAKNIEAQKSTTSPPSSEESTIESHKSSKRSSWLAGVGDFLSRVWAWVKAHIFCLCLDEKSEKIQAMLSELKPLYQAMLRSSTNNPELIQNAFKKVSLSARLEISEGLIVSPDLKKALSGENNKEFTNIACFLEAIQNGADEVKTLWQRISKKSQEEIQQFIAASLESQKEDHEIQTIEPPFDEAARPSCIQGTKLLLLEHIMAQNPLVMIEGRILLLWLVNDTLNRMKDLLND